MIIQLLESPIPLFTAAPDDHLQEAGPSFWQPRKGHEKCIFETLHKDNRGLLQKLLSFRYQNPNQTAFRGFYGPPPILKSPIFGPTT